MKRPVVMILLAGALTLSDDSAVSTPGSGRQCKCRARGSKDIQYRAGRDIQ